MQINPIAVNMANPLASIASANTPVKATSGSDFGNFLMDAIQQVDGLQKEGEVASIGLATGQIQDVHTAMIAMQKASLSLSLTTQIRDKVVEAYQEVMRMQI